ncbi:Citrinin biosynthesis cluster MFS transporter mrr1 [Exophiala dermatitidis]|uniref:MFS transporter, DHA1 family, multidrug resistance protein n=2 Tax=Exophiala dermatitidis TaxID=5970 RepID=H6BNT6_EXODN|nr:MFS transporter, DHA1 family, multidrug resistance protein [Exophiala dermatitidis NIH/UT8656]EHY52271.1 MFS transporter, DHA1 family, multidrug resistance protein [Exophiala dermatitidis NIH/UT8656]KAJ4504710.1 hypothetical protein HRR75_007522 [Exophiala dermatitidis]KAJ4554145.1 hypothetical protein HRR78_002549 [Exophiala dermatitidis]
MQDIEGADLPSSQGATGMDLEKDTNSPPSVPVTPARNPADDIVDFDGPDDPHNPQNWSKKKKWRVTAAMGGMTFVVTFASSIYSVAIVPVAHKYHIGEVTSILGVSLFLLGFVFGPIIFGPASEVFGRRVPLIAGFFAFAVFQIPVAVAQNVETIMLGRFFGGFAASSPLAVVGGALADIWGPIDRAYAVCIFAAAAFVGPVAGPIIGGFITQSYLGWRWTAWITLIIAALFGLIGLICVPETSAARILQAKAKRLRYETKNWALHAKADERRVDAWTLLSVYLIRPFVMFVQEPILALVTAYMSFIYGILYLFFEAFPISFQEERHWNQGVGALPFAAFIVGIAMGTGVIAYSTRTNFTRAFHKHGKVVPEERLPPMIVGAAALPIGLFWFAWTSNPHITWVPQVLSTALLGAGCLVTFWQGMNYIIDCYGFYSNSAIAINTFVRSLFGAGFPLFAPAMYHNLGVPWATSLLGFLCLAFLPVPVLFYRYGAQIRLRSRFRPVM